MTFATSRDPHQERLGTPAGAPRVRLPRISADTFGRFSEKIARYFGTARFLAIQTVVVAVWIGLNVAVPAIRWDKYPFVLLNLAFSTQAAYAAPFILLAQNRQAVRDRVQYAEDRDIDARQRATTDFITVELADLRRSQSNAATRDYIDRTLARELTTLRAQLVDEIRRSPAPDANS